MSLAPALKLTLGNFLYESQVANIISYSVLLPGVNYARTLLPAEVEMSAELDDDGVLELDGGEGSDKILTGKIKSIHRGLVHTEVIVADASAELGSYRPAATYEKQNAKDVVKALASEVEVGVDTIDIDLPLAAYVAHQQRTAAEHIAYLAKLAGGFGRIGNDGKLRVTEFPEGQPEAALRYGREVITYEITNHTGSRGRAMMIGNGPAGSADAPNALRHTLEVLPSDAPTPGIEAVWKATPLLRTPGAALKASNGAAAEKAMYQQRLRAKCILLPKLQPGMVMEVQELPNEMASGPWMLVQVTHHFKAHRPGFTILEGVTAGAGEGSLLGALASAAGGLL